MNCSFELVSLCSEVLGFLLKNLPNNSDKKRIQEHFSFSYVLSVRTFTVDHICETISEVCD